MVKHHLPHPLRIQRTVAGMTQTDVAKIVGRSQTYISSIERGFVVPTKDEARAIAKAVGATPGALGFVRREGMSP